MQDGSNISDLREKEVDTILEIVEALDSEHNGKLPALRDIPKRKLMEEVKKDDKVLGKIKTHGIAKTNKCCFMLEQ